MVAGGVDKAGGDVLGEVFSPPPDPPLHATRTATRAMSDLVTDWEKQPPITLSLYLKALATIPGCPVCGKRRSAGSELEHGEERRQRDLALHGEPGPAEQGPVLGRRPLPPRAGEDEHLEVHHLGEARGRALWDGHLRHEHSGSRRHRAPDVAENRRAALVVPVVDDREQRVQVVPLGHGGEEITGDELAPVGDTLRGEGRTRRPRQLRQIEYDSAQRRVRGEQVAHDGAGTTAAVAPAR